MLSLLPRSGLLEGVPLLPPAPATAPSSSPPPGVPPVPTLDDRSGNVILCMYVHCTMYVDNVCGVKIQKDQDISCTKAIGFETMR